MNNLPIENCYWVVPDKFLAGEYPRELDDESSRQKIGALLKAGVTAFIDLTHDKDGLQPYAHFLAANNSGEVAYQRFPIRDVSVPTSRQQTTAILDAIDSHIQQGRIVYVHCWGGVGRTGVIVGCWLARHGNAGQQALIQLRDLWRQCPKSSRRESPETREQELYVIGWNENR